MSAKSCLAQMSDDVTRRKVLDVDIMATPLKRCLTWWHLTFFGVGQMLGAGVYVLTGTVARNQAGPATFISYIIAGVCALLAALCYAELGTRCPKAGSAYTYTYISVGELLGFVVGWNLLLEYCIGCGSTARAWGGAFNSLSNDAIRNWTLTNIGSIRLFGYEEYPDFVAIIAIIVSTAFVLYGAELSMNVAVIITAINLVAAIFIVGTGLSLSDTRNWGKPDGFAPKGTTGIISGASMLFYSYVGFDSIAIASEEAINPSRAIPIANALSIGTVMFIYTSTSIALTLAVPYDLIQPDAAFAEMFRTQHMDWARIIVNVVMLIVIQGTTLSGLYAGPRCAYSMSQDGLIFKCFGYVHPKTQTPIWSILFFAFIAALAALLLNVEALAEFVSLGTLLASYAVCACVLIYRYEPECGDFEHEAMPLKQKGATDNGKHCIGNLKQFFQNTPVLRAMKPGLAVKFAVMVLAIDFAIMAICIPLHDSDQWSWTKMSGLIITSVVVVMAYIVIVMHTQNDTLTTFQVPFAPLTPMFSMFVIASLLFNLSAMAWARFAVWMTVGLLIYFGYGIRNSHEKDRVNQYSTLDSGTQRLDSYPEKKD